MIARPAKSKVTGFVFETVAALFLYVLFGVSVPGI